MTAVRTLGLTRDYVDRRAESATPVQALAGVDLTVEPGEVYGLLGPNGAGKTTLCRILSTVLLPTAGSAHVMGHDVVTDARAAKRSLGIVFGGDRGLYGRLTVGQNLRFWGGLYGLYGQPLRRRCALLLERLGLADRHGDLVETLSRGMKQRLHLARGLVADPPLLILDEPTVGMDPVAAQDFRTLVADLRADGRTVLMTTHDMAEAEAVCDRVSLVDHGRLLATDTPAGISALVSRHERVDAEGVPPRTVTALAGLDGVVAVHSLDGAAVRVETDGTDATRRVLRHLVDAGAVRITTSVPSLEEAYLRLIGDRGMSVTR